MEDMAVRTHLVAIGHSRGVRIPRALIEQAELTGELELEATPGQLVIRTIRHPREGWAEEAAAMHAAGEDRLLDPPVATDFDRNEWTW
jgi:antitoxin MazE